MLRWGRIEVSGGFLLVAAALYYLDTQNLLPWAAAACALHELGHYLVIRLFGGRVAALRLSCTGAEMALSARRPLPELGAFCAALAGPGMNLLLAACSVRLAAVGLGEDFYVFAGLNLGMACFNLLPVAPLDGGRALRSLAALLWSGALGERLVQLSSLAVSLALTVGGGVLVLRGRANITLLITACWLLAASVPKGVKKRAFT